VILSGGDPFSIDDRALCDLLDRLEAIPHIDIVRFHTRFPLGIPERITPELLKVMSSRRYQIMIIVHINHLSELDDEILTAIKSWQTQGFPVLTHTVLLKGVNDSFETLYDLFSYLSKNGILPYYLFELDKVKGAERFFVEREKGISLIQRLRCELPGYAVPRFAVEIAGEPHKQIIA
jgi:KamA family protein